MSSFYFECQCGYHAPLRQVGYMKDVAVVLASGHRSRCQSKTYRISIYYDWDSQSQAQEIGPEDITKYEH